MSKTTAIRTRPEMERYMQGMLDRVEHVEAEIVGAVLEGTAGSELGMLCEMRAMCVAALTTIGWVLDPTMEDPPNPDWLVELEARRANLS
jgi:hypothetical protein